MASHLTTNRGYLRAFDGWRGIVSMLVVFFHFYAFFCDEQCVTFGYLGVDFFFVLSGFIISRQYEARIAAGEIGFGEFAVRRLARLYPLYLFSIVLFIIISRFYESRFTLEKSIDYGSGIDFVWRILLQLTLLSNIGGMRQPWNGPAWSISVEWIVNVLFFVAVMKLFRIPNLALLLVVIACDAYLISHSPYTLHLTMVEQSGFNPTIARGIAGFTVGMLLYRLHERLPELKGKTLHATESTIILAAAVMLWQHERLRMLMCGDYLTQTALIPALIGISLYRKSWICQILEVVELTWLGKISYSIYLLHLPLGYAYYHTPFFQEHLQRPWYGWVFIGLLLVLCQVSYSLVETPLRRLVRRLLVA